MRKHLKLNYPTLCRQWFDELRPLGIFGGAMLAIEADCTSWVGCACAPSMLIPESLRAELAR